MLRANFLIFLVLILLADALSAVQLPIQQEKDIGIEGTEHFGISINYDCNKTITFFIFNQASKQTVSNATILLFYEERYTPLLANGKTDEEGKYVYTLVGNPMNMRKLFSAVVEKNNYIKKQFYFYLPAECATEKQNESENIKNESANKSTSQNNKDGSQNSSNLNESTKEDARENMAAQQKNQSGLNSSNASEKEESAQDEKKNLCCGAAVLPIAILAAFIANRNFANQNRTRSNRT